MKKVVDVCCGPKGMWFDKKDNRALFIDKRNEKHIDIYPCGTKTNIIQPDVVGDFRNIKLPNEFCYHVVFDPPHILHGERKKIPQIIKKYGSLQGDWQKMLKEGFIECFRILKPNGTLIFKWNETEITVKQILKLTDKKPLYGHKSGKKMNTHWIAFIK